MSNAQATYDGLTPEDVYGVEEEEDEEALLRVAYTQEGWIHPEEDLPLVDSLVLGIVPTNKGHKCYLVHLVLTDRWVTDITAEEVNVIAWQHLPEIPEGGW